LRENSIRSAAFINEFAAWLRDDRAAIVSEQRIDREHEAIMAIPLMPKATAVWLVETTKLTFSQIADFCGMHALEIQGIADGDVAVGIMGQDPVQGGEVTREEILRCEEDDSARMAIIDKTSKYEGLTKKKRKTARYTPIARRQDKPEAIAWIVKNHPYIPDSKIVRLIGTTKKTIEAIRERTHWNIHNIKPKDPVLLALCTQIALNALIEKFGPKQTQAEASDDAAVNS
jgi:hypothetical protein